MPKLTPPQSSPLDALPPDPALTLPTLAQDALTAAHDAIVDHCWGQHPKEAVGLVWDDGQVVGLKGRSGARGFHVSPRSLQATLATRPHRNAIAIYHSHPSGAIHPSSTDMDCMKDWAQAGVEVLWAIVVLGAYDSYPVTSTVSTYAYNLATHTTTLYHRLSS